MSNQWQARRGTTAQNDAFTGASGEITYDTESQGLRIHDGTKQGGYLIDTVVDFQKPTAENNYTWYRLYASGWVEQGGYYTGFVNAGSSVNITLPITMADTNYTCSITGEQNSNNWAYGVLKDGSRTTTSFQIFAGGGGSSDGIKGACWQVSGIAA